VQDVGNNNVFLRQNNKWLDNTYNLGPGAKYFVWMNADRSEGEWRTFGFDQTGAFFR
jgi:hypothetical protein